MSLTEPKPKSAVQLGLMQGVALQPTPAQQVTLANWQKAPYNRWSFQHVQSLIPCARLPRSRRLGIAFKYAPLDLGDLRCQAPDGSDTTIDQMLESTYTDAFLVMHRGELVNEQYFNGMGVDSVHLMMSCTKSYVGSLAGIYVEEGLLDPEAPITRYVPKLEGTGFAGATLRQCLDMSCGVHFSEAYDDPESDIRRFETAYGWVPTPEGYTGPSSLTDAMLSLTASQFVHGDRFEYRSAITLAVQLAIEQVTGLRVQELISERIWQPLGCEWDGALAVDRHNRAITEGGLNATARDWIRFGQMMAKGGYYNGQQIIPEAWVRDCRFGDVTARQAFKRSKYAGVFETLFPNACYRNQWWTLDAERGVIVALGIHGQSLYVDPANEVVIAKFSTHPEAEMIDLFQSQLSGMNTIAETLGCTTPANQ